MQLKAAALSIGNVIAPVIVDALVQRNDIVDTIDAVNAHVERDTVAIHRRERSQVGSSAQPRAAAWFVVIERSHSPSWIGNDTSATGSARP